MIVPSLLRVMLDTYSDLQNRLLTQSGSAVEALSVDLSQRFVTQMPQAILLNLYGLSECGCHLVRHQIALAAPCP